MNQHELPADLKDMELLLAGRSREEPSADFRRQVLLAVRRELRQAEMRAAGSFWKFAAATAAAALLGINLSMSVANNTDWGLCDRSDRDRGEETPLLPEMIPEMTDEETRRQVFLSRLRSRVIPMPLFSGVPSVTESTDLNID